MADLHTRTLAAIAEGPQRLVECVLCKGVGSRTATGFTGNPATHNCTLCRGYKKIEETNEQFATRIALIEQECEREECAKLCDDERDDNDGIVAGPMLTDFGKHTKMSMAAGASNCAAAIRRRGKK